ncbi:RmlC-like cupin domain-containing protein [Elsinoe ampelina]|uniref:RmlC-like cupin domain-containing protein n=1 Tax=Elsinoe ampelina TaxID=302913 RepID=A0A6A6GM71_9PEZI|nr:RmlC-like cupin domain-containing protein [Elsinoe ampelina]
MSAPQNSSFAGLPVIPPNDPSLTSTASKPRTIKKVFEAVEQAEGAGARVRRSVGTPHLRNLTPFLMCDNFAIAPGAGFPDHPHRGQETITYLLKGAVDHEDFAGNKGTIHTGDLQFMTAGKGIVHAEMPSQNPDGSENVGIQLWVDLPERLKNCEPRYRDLKASEIPTATSPDGKVTVKVISGRSYGVDSLQELAYTPVWFLDVTVQPGGTFSENIPSKWNSFIYTLNGTATFGSGSEARKVNQYHNIVWNQEDDTIVAAVDESAKEAARFILVAGLPLDQKIIQYGPFVVSKQEDIYKAMFDYQSYSNGFERARDWESEIGKTMVH